MSASRFEVLARQLENLIMLEIRFGDVDAARVLMRNYAMLWKVGCQ